MKIIIVQLWFFWAHELCSHHNIQNLCCSHFSSTRAKTKSTYVLIVAHPIVLIVISFCVILSRIESYSQITLLLSLSLSLSRLILLSPIDSFALIKRFILFAAFFFSFYNYMRIALSIHFILNCSISFIDDMCNLT